MDHTICPRGHRMTGDYFNGLFWCEPCQKMYTDED